jgi:hypothetical protein
VIETQVGKSLDESYSLVDVLDMLVAVNVFRVVGWGSLKSINWRQAEIFKSL